MTAGSPLGASRAQLNQAQSEAAASMRQGWDGSDGAFSFPVVEGPPGTGKTTVGVIGACDYILENPKSKVCYLAYTNFAAEKAREQFAQVGFGPETVIRISANLRETNWNRGVVGCHARLADLTPNEQRHLKERRVLIATLHSSGRIFEIFRHPLIVIDEFSQVSPSMFFSTVSKVSTTSSHNPAGFVLLGDPNQLPVISSQSLLRPNIGTFLLTRKKDYVAHQLEVQYRMNEKICLVVNALREALNTYALKTDKATGSRTLESLGFEWNSSTSKPSLQQVLDPQNPLVLIDTDGLPGEEQVGFGGSKFYTPEARLASFLARKIHDSYSGVAGEKLLPTILSPYNAQVGALASEINDPTLQNHCSTIYKAQGREYPAVIVSFARKNPQGEIGFLAEPELRAQTYVACSRAMVKLILLFSFSTFNGYPDFAMLLDRCHSIACIADAAELWRNLS